MAHVLEVHRCCAAHTARTLDRGPQQSMSVHSGPLYKDKTFDKITHLANISPCTFTPVSNSYETESGLTRPEKNTLTETVFSNRPMATGPAPSPERGTHCTQLPMKHLADQAWA